MNIRLFNAQILTMEKEHEIFSGEVWIRDGKIIYVADAEEIRDAYTIDFPMPVWDREVDCEGNLLMPGFKDAHTHSAMTLMRSMADDMPLQEWLEKKIFPTEAKLLEDDIYQLTKLAVLEYLTSGITAVFDMYIMPDAVGRACEEMGMRCVLVSGLNNFTSSVMQTENEFLKWNQPDSLVTYQLGCHAEYTCDLSLLQDLSELVHKYRMPVFTHMSETIKEVVECKERYGLTPPALFDSLGLFDFGGGIYHGVYLTDADQEILKNKNICVITNPASNGKLASGMAPIKDLLSKGISVALGTDGPSSNNCLDMFREMFLVSAFSHLREKDASSIPGAEILKMATVNGSYAMCLPDTDVLACGKAADLILIDLKQPNMQPIHNIVNNIVYSGSKTNIKMTMIHGRILYENGKFSIGEEPEMIYKKCNEIVQRIVNG